MGDTPSADHDGPQFRSGFACLVGRPNAGKSTLTNALVGTKVAITSSKPQTTRHAVRGIVSRPDAQLVLIDTPGLSKPRSLLQERLNDLVHTTWAEVDVIAVCFPANQHVGPGDEYLAREITHLPARPRPVAIVTKTDLVGPERLAHQLLAVAALGDRVGIDWEHLVPCSALDGSQLTEVADVLIAMLAPGPVWYPDGELTDEPSETLVAELIREAALADVRDELPHSIAVEIDEMRLRPGRAPDRPLLDIFASMVVERESQKPILIGRRAERIKQVGIAARRQIEALLGTPVHLDLKVRVLKQWQRDPKHLNRLGF